MRLWRVRSALLRRLAERRLSSEHAGWAEGSCVTSWRFHEAVLRVIASPSWGPSSLSSRAKRLLAVLARPNPDGVRTYKAAYYTFPAVKLPSCLSPAVEIKTTQRGCVKDV